jgi:hypothetical protein
MKLGTGTWIHVYAYFNPPFLLSRGGYMKVNDDWWPEPLKKMSEENPLSDSHVIVAEISEPWGPESFRELTTALVPPDMVPSVLESSGSIMHEVETSGPHPGPYNDRFQYQPTFWISGGLEGKQVKFEPLVVSWGSGENKVWLPDQGFLMTYGLIPSLLEKEGLILWDDLEKPKHDVVKCKPVSSFSHGLKSQGMVSIDKEYLQDYATVRNLSIVHVYYAHNIGRADSDIHEIMEGNRAIDIRVRGRRISIDLINKLKVAVQVWGSRHLIDPNTSPVIKGRWQYGKLKWPGIEKIVSEEYARHSKLSEYVYIKDTVLEKYEKDTNLYKINPESGSVRYKNQWSVTHCQRIGRDYIQIELKKLYEGLPPDVVKHFYKFAVDPPPKPINKYQNVPNIGTRSKRIVYNLVEMGERLADIFNSIVGGQTYDSGDFVKLKRSELDYSGWCTEPSIIPITKHIPADMDENSFLERCKDLNILIVEGLNEKDLRKMLLTLNVNSKAIENLKGLKLLDILIRYGIIVEDSGLEIVSNAVEVEKRRTEKIVKNKKNKTLKTPLELIFALNDLRNKYSHGKQNIDTFLEKMGVVIASLKSGWGYELDGLYDRLGDTLEEISKILSTLLGEK